MSNVLLMDAARDHNFLFAGDEPTYRIDDELMVDKGPVFNVSEAAKVFFGKSAHWLRWQEERGKLVLDGNAVGTRRTGSQARIYTLSDIEEVAHALAQNGGIDGTQLNLTIRMVELSARVWRYI